MWTLYKREIMEKEKQEKDFLKKYYKKNKEHYEKGANKGGGGDSDKPNPSPPDQHQDIGPGASAYESLPVQLDSDEEPLSMSTVQRQASREKKAEAEKQEQLQQLQQQEQEKSVLEKFAAGDDKTRLEETKLPKWLYKYLVFRFNLLDRTGEQVQHIL